MAPTAKPLGITTTPIPGFLRIDLTVHGDNRGWFKENWQREKMVALGLPDFQPVQNNISFNDEVGVTRGIHAEPWDKFVSVATGRVGGPARGSFLRHRLHDDHRPGRGGVRPQGRG